MSYHLENSTAHYPIKTAHGHVVYHRKRHAFTYCDLRRINRVVEAPSHDRGRFCKLIVESEILGGIDDLDTAELRTARSLLQVALLVRARELAGASWSSWGGGGFGGAGASGTFRWPWEPPFPP